MKKNILEFYTSGWKHRVSLVLIFTMLFSVFMGWYQPKEASAAITTLQAWSNVYTGTARPTAAIPYDVPAGTMGASRMLVVAVSSVLSAAATTQTCTVSYGGQNLIAVANNFATSSGYHTALFYLQDSGLQAATNNQLTVNLSAVGTQWTAQVDAAVFEGVDQSGTPMTNSQSWLNTGTAATGVGPFATGLTIAAGDLAVEAVAITRTLSGTPRTITTWATNWSSAFGPTTQANGTNAGTNLYMAHNTTAGTTTSGHTASNTTFGSMSAMSIKMLPMNLQVANGTNPANANAGQGTLNNALNAFTMAASAGGVSVNSVTLTGSVNFTAANIAGVSVYQDNGTVGTLDGADVLIPSSYSAITGNATVVTFTTAETCTTTAKNYLVTVDIAAAATTAQTFTGRITAASGAIGTPTYNDTASATLTIQSAPGLTVGNGTNPVNADAEKTSMNNALDAFTLVTANALGGTAQIDTLTVTGNTNFTTANISDIHIYEDNGTVGTFDGADVLVLSTASVITGNATTLTFTSPLPVTNTVKNYLIVADIAAGATYLNTVTGRVTAAAGHGLATPTYSDTNSATLTIKEQSKITSCASCHGYTDAFADAVGSRNTGSFIGDHNAHVVRAGTVCSTCHVTPATESSADYAHRNDTIQMKAGAAAISGGYYDKDNSTTYTVVSDETWSQTNTVTTRSCRNISCHGGNNPTPVWGVGTAGCVDCHNGIVSASKASVLSGGTVTQREAIVASFSLTSRHIRSRTASPAVTNNDCGVCHMEGNATDGSRNASYHGNGYIELRDPDLGSTIKGVTHSGSTSAAGTYSSTVVDARPINFKRNLNSATIESDTAAIMVNLCLKCHDANGAQNSSAWVPSGTAYKPFNATVTANTPNQGVLDVAGQFAGSNRSFHPVLVRNNNGYANTGGTRMVAPWNGVTKTGTTTVYGPLITCWDCHAPNGTGPVTLTNSGIHGGTVSGADVVPLRGNVYINGTTNAANLCRNCHGALGTTTHGAGSALTSSTNGGMTYLDRQCYYCHSSRDADSHAPRPQGAGDAHGFSTYADGTAIPASDGYAFFRRKLLPHSVRQVGATAYTANCGNATGICNQGMGNYTPGGVY